MFFFFFNEPDEKNVTRYESVSEATLSIIQDMMDKVMDRVLV